MSGVGSVRGDRGSKVSFVLRVENLIWVSNASTERS